jgi:hypothetical protein
MNVLSSLLSFPKVAIPLGNTRYIMSATFMEELSSVVQRVPKVRNVHFDSNSRRSLTVETAFEGPLRLVHVGLSDAYLDEYPRGEVSFVAGDVFHLLGSGELVTLEALCKRIVETCELLQEVPLDMGGQETSSWARAASGELITPPTSCREGTFSSGLHPQLQDDMQSTIGGLQFIDHPSLGMITATVSVPLDGISEVAAEAWDVIRSEPLQVSVTFKRNEYLASTVRVEVGQERNFKEHTFMGLPGQVKLIVQRFCEAHHPAMRRYLPLVQQGYLLEDIVAVSPGTGVSAKPPSSDVRDVGRAHPSATVTGFFNRLHQYVLGRLKTISAFCAICDHPLEAGSLMRLSICSRPVCTFRFEDLDVGKNFGFSAALQTGVVDLLFNFAKTAALSARWDLIFNPFPQVSVKGKMIFSPEKKDACIETIREVFKTMPASYALLSKGLLSQQLNKAHALAPSLFQWIVSSNKSHLVKLDPQQQFTFMTTPHQYVIAMSSDERVDKFNELKSRYGSSWAFHGSNGENWHSILRNGLKNASGTKLQVNGTAYGNGVYLSPNASTSFGYSHVASAYDQSMSYNSYLQKPQAPGLDASELAGTFIHRESMISIAICEVIEHDIKKSGCVWVQPDETSVMARYFFVYHTGFDSRGDVDLTKPDLLKMMRERSASMITR